MGEAIEAQGQHPNPGQLWKNRRKMAWLSMFYIIGIGVYTMVVTTRGITIPQTNADIMVSGMWPCAAVVGAYIGFVVGDKIWSK